MNNTQEDKAKTFSALHEEGTFIMPNFWDAGSAVILQNLGAKALASTSAGFAQSLGRTDYKVSLSEKLAHLEQIAAITELPISADFENGFADSPETCAANLVAAAETGIVGASIEDWSGTEIYDLNLAVERIAACAEARAKLDFDFILTARAENLLHGINDLDDTIKRLVAFEEAGADVLYAPGLATPEQVKAVIDAVSKPINVLFVFMPDRPLSFYQEMGVRRISLGSALANTVLGTTIAATRSLLDDGDFSWVRGMASGKDMQKLLN